MGTGQCVLVCPEVTSYGHGTIVDAAMSRRFWGAGLVRLYSLHDLGITEKHRFLIFTASYRRCRQS